jgi:hypothetical protein
MLGELFYLMVGIISYTVFMGWWSIHDGGSKQLSERLLYDNKI